jgi:hypothetical protein
VNRGQGELICSEPRAMLCYAMLRYATLCYAMLCYAMLCYAMLCYAMLALHAMRAHTFGQTSGSDRAVQSRHRLGQ